MSTVELSKRAEGVFNWVQSSLRRGDSLCGNDEFPIRQQTLADLLGCSRRSIYRALQELKKHGYLQETGTRENRCKVYQLCRSYRAQTEKVALTWALRAKARRSPGCRTDRPAGLDAKGTDSALRVGSLETERHEMSNWVQVKCDDEIRLTPRAQAHWGLYEKIYRIVFKEPELFEKYCQVARALRKIENDDILWVKTWGGLNMLHGYPQSRRQFEGLNLEEIARVEISVVECRS